MTNENFERDLDDEVYEDEYYDEHYEEEELMDGQESEEEEFDDMDDESWDDEKRIHISFACEDCDYRWDDTIVKKKTGNLEDEEEEEPDVICPMCGSMNITQI